MKHQKLRECIPLFVYGELDEDERYLLEEHLSQCSECREQLEDLKRLVGAAGKPTPITEKLLEQARRELWINLKALEPRLRSSRFADWDWRCLAPCFSTVAAGFACLLVGLAIGYLLYRDQPTSLPTRGGLTSKPGALLPISPDQFRVGNVRFIDSDTRDGQVEFTFEATAPIHMRGSMDDPQVQEVLSQALVNAQNPGVRLRAVNLLGAEQLKQTDADVKKALITALTSDENAGVRKQALAALKNFPFDDEIRDALLYVLTKDPSPAMRIAAIDGIKSDRYRDPEVMRVLEDRMQTDGNEYIRLRSRAVVKEVSQQ